MKQLNFTTDCQTLNQDDEGTIRVKGSRVTLDTFINAFKRGDTAEQIQEGFPSLKLAQIRYTIGWYLNNQEDVDDYLRVREYEADALRQRIETQSDYGGFRETIRRRREQLIKG